MKIPKDLAHSPEWRLRSDGLWEKRYRIADNKMRLGWRWCWRAFYRRICESCGGPFLANKSDADKNPDFGKYCCHRCASYAPQVHVKGKANGNWKGGVTISADGYRLLLRPHHPNANRSGYVRESRLIASEMYGRRIAKGEVVHHDNENRLDNRPENLKVMTRALHISIHHRGKPKPRRAS